MIFRGVSFQSFRNYRQQTFLFEKPVTVIVGQNASGKTSIIEAIALLSTGSSFRADQVEEMISFDQEIARVKGKIEHEQLELEALLTRGIVQGKSTHRSLFSVNDVRRRKKDFSGKFFVVVFRPEDMRLVEGSPGRRRRFIDTVLEVTDPIYADALKQYEDSLKRRNRLLQQIQEGAMQRSVLSFWTNAVVKYGEILQEKRRQFFAFFTEVEFPLEFSIHSLPSIISAARMQEYADREVAAGYTLIGPHKDDFEILMNGRNVAAYGSRGQQRLGVLWLKMCELQYITQKTGQAPLLLLDDVLSELDHEHRQDVVRLFTDRQAIVTTADPHVIDEIRKEHDDIALIEL